MASASKEVTVTASTSAPVVAPNAKVKCNLCTYTCEQRAHQYHFDAVHSIKKLLQYKAYLVSKKVGIWFEG